MARFNETIKRNPARRMEGARAESLTILGADLPEIMAKRGIGIRRAMAAAERDLGVAWHNGAWGKDAGHYNQSEA